MTADQLLACTPMFALLLWAAVIDLRSRKIPNWLTLALAAGGLCQSFLFGGTPWPGQSILGLLVGMALPLVLFAIGALGGGDVKLLAAVGTWVGPWNVFAIFAAAAVLGMLIVVVQSCCQRRLGVLLRNSAMVAVNLAAIEQLGTGHLSATATSCRSVHKPLPYAVAVFLGSVLVIFLAWAGR